MSIICKECKKEFIKKWYKQQFCCVKCSNSYNNKKTVRPKKSKKCKYCDNLIYGRITNQQCCSICTTKSKKLRSIEHCKNVQNITLKELRKKYTTGDYHAKIRGWSRQVYSNNDGIVQCKICGYRLHCDVCHIKPIAKFSDDTLVTKVNDFSNLVCLCPNHHWEFDNGIIILL